MLISGYTISVKIFTAEDELCEVFQEVVDIQSTYYQLGMLLGLPPRELEAIQKAFDKDITQCLTKVLLVWLSQRYNVEKYGHPTWRRLVEAVDNPAGGTNHRLAKAIASKHPAGILLNSYTHNIMITSLNQ